MPPHRPGTDGPSPPLSLNHRTSGLRLRPSRWAVFEAFPVEHSLRAPAVGYRITAGPTSIFYVPDLVYIYEQHEALFDVRMYVGDGASLRRPIIRKSNGSLTGHTSSERNWVGVAKRACRKL